eukprot:4273407-Prorocentrum_lima.AAC.1
MLGEVRLMTEEKSTRASSDVSARLHPSHVPTTSAVTTNPTQKGKGTCNTLLTDEGRPMGRACPYAHPC